MDLNMSKQGENEGKGDDEGERKDQARSLAGRSSRCELTKLRPVHKLC